MKNKVVINSCYGGFGLSQKALDRIVELGYEGLTLNPDYEEGNTSVTNRKYYGVYDIPRHHPALVQAVKELKKEANDFAAFLTICTINGNRYRIEEYDGYETLITPDDEFEWVTI